MRLKKNFFFKRLCFKDGSIFSNINVEITRRFKAYVKYQYNLKTTKVLGKNFSLQSVLCELQVLQGLLYLKFCVIYGISCAQSKVIIVFSALNFFLGLLYSTPSQLAGLPFRGLLSKVGEVEYFLIILGMVLGFILYRSAISFRFKLEFLARFTISFLSSGVSSFLPFFGGCIGDD